MRQRMGQANAADRGRAIGAKRIDEAERILAADAKLGKYRQVSQADILVQALAHSAATLSNQLARRKLRVDSRDGRIGRKPVGPLETVGAAEHRAAALEALVRRGLFYRPPGRALLVGIVNAELRGEAFDRLGHAVFAIGVAAETTRIDRQRIHRRLAAIHPLGQELAGAAAFHDAHGRTGQQPGVAQVRMPGRSAGWRPE